MLDYHLFTDNELVMLLRKNDHAAFTEIYRRYSRTVYSNTYKLLKDRSEVRDIVQEIFASLWNRRADFMVSTNLAGYLYVAARNKVFKIIAHQKVETKYISLLNTSENDPSVIADYAIRHKQLEELIEKEINELPAKMREVLNLSRKSHLSYKEISEKLNISEGTVKKQVSNALKILKVKLASFFYLVVKLIIVLSCVNYPL